MTATTTNVPNYATIADHLRTLRNNRRETQKTVAAATGISVSTIRKFENGRCAKCILWQLYTLCNYYGVKPSDTLR